MLLTVVNRTLHLLKKIRLANEEGLVSLTLLKGLYNGDAAHGAWWISDSRNNHNQRPSFHLKSELKKKEKMKLNTTQDI